MESELGPSRNNHVTIAIIYQICSSPNSGFVPHYLYAQFHSMRLFKRMTGMPYHEIHPNILQVS